MLFLPPKHFFLDLKDFHITHTAQKSLSSPNHRPPSCPPRRALTVKQQTPITPSFSSPFPLACVVWLLRPLRFSSDPASIQHRQGCWKVGGTLMGVMCQDEETRYHLWAVDFQRESRPRVPLSCQPHRATLDPPILPIAPWLFLTYVKTTWQMTRICHQPCWLIVFVHTLEHMHQYKCCVQNIKPAHIVEFPPDSSFQQQ